MTGRRVGRWALLLELAMLAASLGTGGPVAHGVRVIGLIVVGVVGALVVFVAAVFTVGILAQRQPPYPMFGDLEVLAVLERDSSWPRTTPRPGRAQGSPPVLPDLCGGRLIPAVPLAVPSGPSPDRTNSLDRSRATCYTSSKSSDVCGLRGGPQCCTYGPTTPTMTATPSPGTGMPS
jgi:hypothetical protein